EQLQAIEAGSPLRRIVAQVGIAELNEVRRQRNDWQKKATQQLASGRTREALVAYEREGHVKMTLTRDAARTVLLAFWEQAGKQHPGNSRLILAYTREDVRKLNQQ